MNTCPLIKSHTPTSIQKKKAMHINIHCNSENKPNVYIKLTIDENGKLKYPYTNMSSIAYLEMAINNQENSSNGSRDSLHREADTD